MIKKLIILNNIAKYTTWLDGIFIVLQLMIRSKSIYFISKKQKVNLRKGTKDLETFKEIFFNNIYKIKLPIEPKTILDAGANVGISSLFFKLIYPNSKIVAVEIDKENIAQIRSNTSQLNDIIVIHKAIYNKNQNFKISNPYNANNSYQINKTNSNTDFDVSAITIDEILILKNWQTIDILKIDIEGSEKELFESNYQNWLPKVKVIMIETHDRMKSKCSYNVMKAVNNYNFILYSTKEGTLIYYNLDLIQLENL